MTPEQIAAMVADREAGTPALGGWGWFGGRDSLYLATRKGGRRFVMDFARKGLHSAEPRFCIGNIMYGAINHLAEYEVGDGAARGQAKAVADKSVYRLDISGVDHPDARRIARVPEMETAIIEQAAEIARLTAERDDALARDSDPNTRIVMVDQLEQWSMAMPEHLKPAREIRAIIGEVK